MSNLSCVNRALVFIEENLKRRISLEDIADAANYSQWYFHRLFRVLTGHCAGDYLRRRRLCEASYELLYTRKPIAQLAREYQFESQEAFTRSFSALSGISPGRFRRQISSLVYFPAISLDNSYSHLKKGAKNMKVRNEQKPAFRVLGVHCRANPSSTLHHLWNDFAKRVQEIPEVLEPDKAYQVCVFEGSDPATEEFTFIAGMAVNEKAPIPEGMIAHTVPEANYAVFEHRGLLDSLHNTYQYIFGVWMNENGCQMAETDSLEVYDQRFKPNSRDSVFEIWVPLLKD